MSVGFTGTTRGMTGDQAATVARLLRTLYKEGREFHHGAEPHSDAQAAELAEMAGYKIVPHPGGDAKQNIRRNHEIVNVSDVMIAAPRGRKEAPRSGTWATIRYACGALNYVYPPGGPRPMYIVWPDGNYNTYN